MQIRKLRGIVLSSVTYGEGDVIATLLTENAGKRSFSFKGLKRSKRRPHSAAEPGSLINLSCYYKKDRDVLSAGEVTLERSFSGIRRSLDSIYVVHIMLEAVEKSTGRDSPERALFRLLEAALKTLADTPSPYGLAVFFLVHLLRAHGILPPMTGCAVCGAVSFTGFTLRKTDLHPLCGVCSPRNDSQLKAEAKEYLDLCVSRKYSEIDHKCFCEGDHRALLPGILGFIEGHYGVEIKSGRQLAV